ncbi:unnamed protein product [Ixodes pacificus]
MFLKYIFFFAYVYLKGAERVVKCQLRPTLLTQMQTFCRQQHCVYVPHLCSIFSPLLSKSANFRVRHGSKVMSENFREATSSFTEGSGTGGRDKRSRLFSPQKQAKLSTPFGTFGRVNHQVILPLQLKSRCP